MGAGALARAHTHTHTCVCLYERFCDDSFESQQSEGTLVGTPPDELTHIIFRG